jgi:cyclopropane-fatty-acyl-phospholipid synthase
VSVSTTVPLPGLGTVPRAPVSATVARLIFERAVSGLPLRVSYPDGRVLGGGSSTSPVFDVVRPAAFFARLGRDRKIGFGDSFVAGDWRPGPGTDLAELLTVFAERLTTLIPPWMQRLRSLVDRPIPIEHDNSIDGARANIAAHYDLSNELFGTFLDPTMSYSSAWFASESAIDTATDLEGAQLRKIDAMLDLAEVGPGTRLLEVGSGWGSLAIRAGQRGARVTSITLSHEQIHLAEQRIEAAGLTDSVDIRLQDYREVRGTFDAIVSIEMIEAVGENHWPEYFMTLDRLLAPGGVVSIQAITMAHERVLATRRSFGWIQKYIFPGGLIPSLRAIEDTLAAHTTLRVVQRRELREHYARTLRLWRERFIDASHLICAPGFDETFSRMWQFYLAYSEAGFRSGYLGVSQIQLTRASA